MKKVFGRLAMTNEFVRIGVVLDIVNGGVEGIAMESPVGDGDITRRERIGRICCCSSSSMMVVVSRQGRAESHGLNLWTARATGQIC